MEQITYTPNTNKDKIISFYFSTDYNIEEIVDEIQRFITKNSCINYDGIYTIDEKLKGNWTKVPEIKYKLKLIKAKLWN